MQYTFNKTDKYVSYVIEVLNKLQMRKNNSYIAASSAYKDGEILTKTHIQLLPDTKYAQSCRLM